MFGPRFDSEGRVYDELFDMNRDGRLDAGEYCLFDEHISGDSYDSDSSSDSSDGWGSSDGGDW